MLDLTTPELVRKYLTTIKTNGNNYHWSMYIGTFQILLIAGYNTYSDPVDNLPSILDYRGISIMVQDEANSIDFINDARFNQFAWATTLNKYDAMGFYIRVPLEIIIDIIYTIARVSQLKSFY